MEKNYESLLENINKNGLLPNSMPTQQSSKPSSEVNSNIFSPTFTRPSFGHLTTQPTQNVEIKSGLDILNDTTLLNGFDTDILSNSKFKKIDDTTLKLEVKIARLRAELDEHKKTVESAFLKADKNQYQKLLEIQQKMEAEIQKLVVEYQNRQLKSVVLSPFVKLFNFIKSYVVLK